MSLLFETLNVYYARAQLEYFILTLNIFLQYIHDMIQVCSRGLIVELSLDMPEVRGSNPR